MAGWLRAERDIWRSAQLFGSLQPLPRAQNYAGDTSKIEPVMRPFTLHFCCSIARAMIRSWDRRISCEDLLAMSGQVWRPAVLRRHEALLLLAT